MVLPLLPLAIGVTLLIVTIFFFTYRLRPSQSKSTILILGISDAGKTAVYTHLTLDTIPPTVPSMQENEGTLTLNGKAYDIVDVPGHERVRGRYADFLPITRAIVFVVDASTLSQQTYLVADYLYSVLSQRTTHTARIPVLVAINKSDRPKATTPKEAQVQLEREFTKLRIRRGKAVEDQEGDSQDVYLGFEDESFRFDHLENELEFVACSAKDGKVDAVRDWLQQRQ